MLLLYLFCTLVLYFLRFTILFHDLSVDVWRAVNARMDGWMDVHTDWRCVSREAGYQMVTDFGYANQPWLRICSQLPGCSVLFLATNFLPVTKRSSDRVIDRASERSSERAIDRASERLSERCLIERAIERSSDGKEMIVTRAPEVDLTRSLMRWARFLLKPSVPTHSRCSNLSK